jgi:hypothetical protein
MHLLIKWAITVIITVVIIIIAEKMKENEEKYYSLKVIGYFFIGAFRFNFNQLYIPLGFITFLLFLRNPHKNKRAKSYAAIFGLIVVVMYLIIPKINDLYYERDRYLRAECTNIYEFDFEKHLNKVLEKLKIDGELLLSTKAEQFSMNYKKDGQLIDLKYQLIWNNKGQYYHAYINYKESKNKYIINANKVDEWVQYNQLIGANHLFEKLNNIDISELTIKKDYPYYGFWINGWYSSIAYKEDIYIIKDDKIELYEGELPIKGYYFATYGMKKTGSNSHSSEGERYYLFDLE